jgi:LysM repeat protein
MKLPSLFPRKKLRAATARRSPLGLPDEMDYEQMSEPNMKLSRALLIVLVLHVVAVAGIIAFNTIKTHQPIPRATQPTAAASPASNSNSSVPVPAKAESSPAAMTVADSVAVHHDQTRPTHVPQKPAATAADQKTEHTKAEIKPAASPEAGKVYVVAKGDNPVTIAKKFKISQEMLLALNHIDDPKKLQIGQKLLIPPPKPPKAGTKKTSE